eukprot:TRINITY_DN98128_c0_g1_i1.p2 TRINITY_DN98128_c0_g1~~TRINITY_DN98128_c0_g1_i1.p2  ORF type:complete len:103 (-),score=9.56 TRINITY_DN98128_c0_g1_i1:169-477(-)
MRVEVVGRHFEMTDPIREYAEKKAEKLPRHYDQIQMITFRVSGDDHHHTSEFGVELVIDVEHHNDFVATAKEHDVYKAIDQVVAKGVRQLTDFKDKLKTGKR